MKQDGLLLYSTCTVNREENEEVVDRFLVRNPAYWLEKFNDRIDFFGLDEDDDRAAAKGMMTVNPGRYQTDGMFYALMRRKF